MPHRRIRTICGVTRVSGIHAFFDGRPVRRGAGPCGFLGTGAVRRVPGIEAPPKSALGLVFSADGKWLVVALDAGDRIRVLAWRPGLARPFETRAVPGAVYAAPAVALPSG